MTTSKATTELTLFDRLSHLDFVEAAKLLGHDGNRLITSGGTVAIDIEEQVRFRHDVFSLDLDGATVTISLCPGARSRLKWSCDSCDVPCEHVGAAFSVVLEEKLALGLAAPRPEQVPIESLSEAELVLQALADREERARSERMRLSSADPEEIWTDYTLTNAASGRTYRVALRGWERGESYYSCPDFRKNTLGTCKHIIHALDKVRRRFPAAKRRQPHVQREIALHLAYGEDIELRLLLPDELDDPVSEIVRPLRDRSITDLPDLLRRIRLLESRGTAVAIYPDAEELIRHRLLRERLRARASEIRQDPKSHPLLGTLLEADLLPYQLDGIAFAVGAGRAILADDMGLGKTIQGIGVAELLAREAGIEKVLVVSPASVKTQWRSEIGRFSRRDGRIVLGSAEERVAQYNGDAFFTICNYEQVLRDIDAIERVKWDLIILDEGQRIRNWEARTSQTVKSLRSDFALVLSGTPLENRLDDLFSVVEFIDERRLGRLARRSRVERAGGQLISAAFAFLGEMVPEREETEASARMADRLRRHLDDCLERDEEGRPRLTVTLPDDAALDDLARSLAALMGGKDA